MGQRHKRRQRQRAQRHTRTVYCQRSTAWSDSDLLRTETTDGTPELQLGTVLDFRLFWEMLQLVTRRELSGVEALQRLAEVADWRRRASNGSRGPAATTNGNGSRRFVWMQGEHGDSELEVLAFAGCLNALLDVELELHVVRNLLDQPESWELVQYPVIDCVLPTVSLQPARQGHRRPRADLLQQRTALPDERYDPSMNLATHAAGSVLPQASYRDRDEPPDSTERGARWLDWFASLSTIEQALGFAREDGDLSSLVVVTLRRP